MMIDGIKSFRHLSLSIIFLTIQRDKLEVKVAGRDVYIIIKAQNLDECFDKFDNFSSKDNDVSEDDLRDSRDFLKTLKNPEFETETIKIKDLGEFKIYLGSKREDGEKNIGLIRENMFICRLGI